MITCRSICWHPGATARLIAVRTYAAGFTQKAKYKDLKVTNIAPSEDLGPLFNFDPEPIGKNMKMGYYDAMRMIRGLEGKRYYIDRKNAAPGFSCFAGLPDEATSRLAEILGMQGSGKRLLFERIIPRIASMLGLKKDASYDAVFLGLLETLAEPAGLDRYEIYSLQDFAQRLSKQNGTESGPIKSILQAVGAPDRSAQLREAARIVLNGFIGL